MVVTEKTTVVMKESCPNHLSTTEQTLNILVSNLDLTLLVYPGSLPE